MRLLGSTETEVLLAAVFTGAYIVLKWLNNLCLKFRIGLNTFFFSPQCDSKCFLSFWLFLHVENNWGHNIWTSSIHSIFCWLFYNSLINSESLSSLAHWSGTAAAWHVHISYPSHLKRNGQRDLIINVSFCIYFKRKAHWRTLNVDDKWTNWNVPQADCYQRDYRIKGAVLLFSLSLKKKNPPHSIFL